MKSTSHCNEYQLYGALCAHEKIPINNYDSHPVFSKNRQTSMFKLSISEPAIAASKCSTVLISALFCFKFVLLSVEKTFWTKALIFGLF